MPLTLLPVTSISDISTLTRIHLDAFIRVPINRAIWPHGITQSVFSRAESGHLKALESDPSARLFKVVDTDHEDQVVAFGRWHIFDTPEAERQRWDLRPRDWGLDADLDVANRFWAEIVKARQTMSGEAHVFLSILATHESYGRRGAGAMLMKWGTDQADALGLPCFLESTPYGEGLYLKFAFRETGYFDTDISKAKDGSEMYRHIVMYRDAKVGEAPDGVRIISEPQNCAKCEEKKISYSLGGAEPKKTFCECQTCGHRWVVD